MRFIEISKIIVLMITLIICTYTDIKENKIKNKLLIIPLIFGIIVQIIIYGIKGIGISAAAIFIPIGVFLIPFLLRAIGAGDIKLYCVIGAIMGPKFIFYNIIYTLLVGAVIGIVNAVSSGKIIKTIYNIYSLIYGAIFYKVQIKSNITKDFERFPLAIAILVGTLIQLLRSI